LVIQTSLISVKSNTPLSYKRISLIPNIKISSVHVIRFSQLTISMDNRNRDNILEMQLFDITRK